MQQSLPFPITKANSFYQSMANWIADVFYDILPEKGFELRDEQIFMAFQLEKAFKDKKVIFAEAGVGTGKTIVYLLYALSYARYVGKPAIIACADETLIEQLVKKEGDIQKLEKALNLEIDVRLAKSRDQYVCLKKLERAMLDSDDAWLKNVYAKIPDFVYQTHSMTSYEKYGDRKDYPLLTEKEWQRISWDSLQDCFTCDIRHRCGQTLHRDAYRKATDFIICSQDFYMEHIWTKESRKREGQLPLLPEESCVVFDEGHLLEFASQKAMTYRIKVQTVETLLTNFMQNDMREETLNLIEQVLELNNIWFQLLMKATVPVDGSNRLKLKKTPSIINVTKQLYDSIQQLTEALVFESELFQIDHYDLHIVEEYLEQMLYSLQLLIVENKGIHWMEEEGEERTLVMMPRLVEEVLEEKVFSKKIPFIFSSATLSTDNNFTYLAQSLGIHEYESFSVDSPFDYEKQMEVYLHKNKESKVEKWDTFIDIMLAAGGRTLVLFRTEADMMAFQAYAKEKQVHQLILLFEGEREISNLVKQFQEQEETVLCAYHLWEGLDIPGSTLSNVIIDSLPYPPSDPVFEAKRSGYSSPFTEVDIPYMLLKLRQGMGRLIRTSTDTGTIHLWLTEYESTVLLPTIQTSFFKAAQFVSS